MVGVVFKAFLCKFLLNSMAEGTCTKKILVELEDDAVPVSFVSGGDVGSDNEAATEAAATQLDVPPTDLVLKIQNEEWGGRWVNVCKNDVIPDKAILQAVLRKSAKVWLYATSFCSSLTVFFIKLTEKSRNWDCKHNHCCCQGIHAFDGYLIRGINIMFVIIGSQPYSNAPVFFTRSNRPSQTKGRCM